MAINIDTASVKETANQISTVNMQIKYDFSDVQTAINNLDSRWHGSAADAAMSKFQNLKSTYYENRFGVVNNMVKFIKVYVGDNYELTESTLSSAAAAFK